jgi:HSP20 family protein
MTLVRWNSRVNSARDMVGIQDEVNRLFDSFFGQSPEPQTWETTFRPALDVEETTDSFVIRADLPGIQQKDVKVSLMGETLTIRGERKHTVSDKDRNARRIERSYGVFERSITLDAPVRSEGVKATYHDGVLEIQVPKAEEARVREIEVQSI